MIYAMMDGERNECPVIDKLKDRGKCIDYIERCMKTAQAQVVNWRERERERAHVTSLNCFFFFFLFFQ